MSFPATSVFKLNTANKTIWIFGAGASADAPYNVPLQGNLLNHFFNMKAPGNQRFKIEFDRLKNEVVELCKLVQPGFPAEDAILEEVFSAYEIKAKSAYSTSDEVLHALNAIETLRRALRFSTQVYGNGQAAKWNPHKRNNKSASYAELLEKLYPLGCSDDHLKKHILVTMNYDINIDRCVINMLSRDQGELFVDYGIDFADYRLSNSFTRPGDRSVLLLRLHGGLNWIRCKACNSMFTTINKHANVVKTDKCKMCKCERLEQVLVHPSYTRSYSDPILQIIWGRFQEELVNSDRWVFIGYSLPTADVHLRELLRHSLSVRKSRRKKTKIIWVGKRSNNKDPKWLELAKSYFSVFEKNVKAWKATTGGFSYFVQEIRQ